MNKLRLFAILLLIFSISACSAPRPTPPPSWLLSTPEMAAEGLVVVGMSYPSPDERTARESAIQASMTEFLRYTGMEVSSYAKMITRETTSSGMAQIQMDNMDHTSIATAGFVQKAMQRAWHVEKNSSGKIVAYAQVLIPASEVKRIEEEKKALLEAKTAPYRKARSAFETAIKEHRIIDALQMIPQVSQFSRNLESVGIPYRGEAQLVQEATEGLVLGTCKAAYFDLDRDQKATISLCINHRGGVVKGLPVAVKVPSGRIFRAVTGEDGSATINLPKPMYPGTYSLQGFIDHSDFPGIPKVLSLEVKGEKTGIAQGVFHDFIEVVEFGSANTTRYPDRRQAEQAAIQTARHLAYARLLEMRDGMTVNSENEYSGSGHQSIVRNYAAGHVEAQIVSQDVLWKNELATAQVKIRAVVE